MPEALREWWPVLTLIIPLALAAVGWAIRKGLVSKDELIAAVAETDQRMSAQIGQLEARLKEGDDKFAHLARQIENTPSKQELHEVLLAIRGQSGEINVLAERIANQTSAFGRIEATLTRHEQHFSDGRR